MASRRRFEYPEMFLDAVNRGTLKEDAVVNKFETWIDEGTLVVAYNVENESMEGYQVVHLKPEDLKTFHPDRSYRFIFPKGQDTLFQDVLQGAQELTKLPLFSYDEKCNQRHSFVVEQQNDHEPFVAWFHVQHHSGIKNSDGLNWRRQVTVYVKGGAISYPKAVLECDRALNISREEPVSCLSNFNDLKIS